MSNRYKKNIQKIKISINSKIYFLDIPLIGYFQVKNLLMSILAASLCGLKLDKILTQIHKIKPVLGRLECVSNLKNNSKIIVDFAHTPDALEQALIAIKKQFNKEIILVFGCGGERDKKKRLSMGRIAQKYCRKIFVTDDNPRNENPKNIRRSIIAGCKKSAIDIGNRKKAIRSAIKELNSNEVLLVAGKGHEKNQDYGSYVIEFSDKKKIKKIVHEEKVNSQKINYKTVLLNKAFKNNFKNINFNDFSTCFDISGETFEKNVKKLNNFAIGPEGGWTDEELSKFKYIIKISEFSLRTETAAISAVSLMM